MTEHATPPVDLPLAMLCELTHRCPLKCAYCSNPLALEPMERELTTEQWAAALSEAAALGILQVHFSGGEPTVRRDLPALVRHATGEGLYTNLITSGVTMTPALAESLADAGLEHAQIGFPDCDEDGSAFITSFKGGLARKLKAAEALRSVGVALTLNAVMTRHNIPRLEPLIDLALSIGARRIEVANVQYYGWALKNRAALMPSPEQLHQMTALVERKKQELAGQLVIDYVIPDYYARRPKSCLGGWGRRFLNLSPSGKVLPCHAAETIPQLTFETVGSRPLADIWLTGSAFNAYRGEGWMPETCRTCDHREADWGGCRCQALALAGSAAAIDPTCERSPLHSHIRALAEREAAAPPPEFVYRQGGS